MRSLRRPYTQRVSAASRRAAAAAEKPESATPSGRLLLRMPRTLHGALTEAAEREGTSLNQFITGTLASAIGWNGDGSLAEAPRGTARAAEESPQSRRLFYLLVANAVAVGLAGLGAIAILLVALLS